MVKLTKRCKVCNKVISEQNRSGLCRHHYQMAKVKETNKIRKKNHICIMCGEKVEPIILYPNENKDKPIIKYPLRCYSCREKQNKLQKGYLLKKKKSKL